VDGAATGRTRDRAARHGKSNSPPCRKKRDKDGAATKMIIRKDRDGIHDHHLDEGQFAPKPFSTARVTTDLAIHTPFIS
jgi:hypothetical protein